MFGYQGNLVNKYDMLGLYVAYGNADDVPGKCQCVNGDKSASFPVLNALNDGILEKEAGGFLTCELKQKS